MLMGMPRMRMFTTMTDSDEKVGLGHARLFEHYVSAKRLTVKAATQSNETSS